MHRYKSILLLGLVVAAATSFAVPGKAVQSTRKERVPGQLVVKLRDAGAAVQTLHFSLGRLGLQSIKPFMTDDQLKVVQLKDDSAVEKAIELLKSESSVEYAEPNLIFRAVDAEGVPNDPDFAQTWGLKNTGQADSAGQIGNAGADINVVPAWKEGVRGSKNVLVAVIDTGIDWDHPDLKDNLYTNPGEIAGNGVDDDKNGFIDDVHGWNFAAGTNNSRDDHNHGTHCAGTIGAKGDNGVGVAGVAWEVTLLPIKFLTADGGGTLSGAVESINYATMMGVHIMSNSWGGGGFTQSLEDAIKKARDKGILFVAAAGNDGSNSDTTPMYPASYNVENIVSVAATDNRDSLGSFSNYGTKTVHVAAPGVKVYSTIKDGKYASYSGTSMATPHVAGVSALLLAHDSGMSYSDIKQRLITTSNPIRSLKRKVVAKGRVNA